LLSLVGCKFNGHTILTTKKQRKIHDRQRDLLGCTFDLTNGSPQWPSFLVSADKLVIQPTLQSGVRKIDLDVGQSVTVACVGGTNNLLVTGQQTNAAVCTSNSKLSINGVEYGYNQLGCVKQNAPALIETGTCAGSEGVEITVGWQVGSDTVAEFTMCHNKKAALNYYSTNTIDGKSVDADDKTNGRPSFITGGYYADLEAAQGKTVNTLYTQVQQTATIAQIVGSTALANEYINVNAQLFLSRGHMAPDGDFISAASQDSSYYFMNVAPQWQTFNGAHWVDVENAARRYATTNRVDLKITTGTFGVTTLADINGVQQEIYLAFDENNNGYIPVPKYYWKVVHEPISDTATAFVGINNPYNQVLPEDIICPDVCSQVPWVTWELTNVQKGYMFCCTTADLHKAIEFAPDMDVPLLL